MGDGQAKHGGGLTLCTDCYSIQDVIRLLNVLLIRYRLVCSLHQPNKGSYRIYISKKSLRLLNTIVGPHMDNSMLYKISLEYRPIGNNINLFPRATCSFGNDTPAPPLPASRRYSTLVSNSANKLTTVRSRFMATNSNLYNDNFSYYLAGLIEGSSGTIIVPKTERSPKGRLNYPSIQIMFDSRDLALALTIQKELAGGSLSKKKGANAYVLTFNSKDDILLIVSLINGKMRTPKIHALYALIDWINKTRNSDSSLKKLPLNSEPLGSNPWLTGFIEGDGSFQVRASAAPLRGEGTASGKRKYPIVECRLELSQSQTYYNGLSNFSFMQGIATFLASKLREVRADSKFPQYKVVTTNLASNIILENYLAKYPIFSSKYLNYKDWLKVLEFKKISKYDTEFLDKVVEIKNGMNNKRTIFVWDHLQGFYKLKR